MRFISRCPVLLNLKDAFVVDLVFELAEASVNFLFEPERIPKPDPSYIENRFDQVCNVVRQSQGNFVIHKGCNEGSVPLNDVFDHLGLWRRREKIARHHTWRLWRELKV